MDDDYNDYNQINLGDFGRRITPVNRSPSPPLTRAVNLLLFYMIMLKILRKLLLQTGQYSYKDGAADGLIIYL